MPNYSYTAKDERGKTVYGTVFAPDEMDLANKISRLGYFCSRPEYYPNSLPRSK